MSNVISRSRDVTRLTWREQQQLAFSVIQLELDSIGGQQHIRAGAVLYMPQTSPNMTFFGSNIPYIDDEIQLPFISEEKSLAHMGSMLAKSATSVLWGIPVSPSPVVE